MKFHVVIMMQYIMGRPGVVKKDQKSEHFYAVKKKMGVKKSALSQHIVDFDYFTVWDEPKILKMEANQSKRRTAESFFF